jgi:hypothetical protein
LKELAKVKDFAAASVTKKIKFYNNDVSKNRTPELVLKVSLGLHLKTCPE